MLWVLVIIGGIISIFISNSKTRQAESNAVSRCKNSDFFSEVQNYLSNDFLVHCESGIREYTRYNYDRYDKLRHEKNKPESRFKPTYCSYGIEIYSSYIRDHSVVFCVPAFDFQEHGYNNLNINQMRALTEALRESNSIWGKYEFCNNRKYNGTVNHIVLYLNDCYVKSIVDDEVEKLEKQTSKYSYTCNKTPF